MAVYTQLQENEIRKIGADYGLTIVDFAPIEAGASNSNYLLHTQQGDYVLTFFGDKTLAHANKLGQLLLLLAEHEFPTTRLLHPVKGGLTTMHKGKAVMLKAHIVGEMYQDLDEAMLRQIGAMMARLHQLPVPDFVPNGLSSGWQCLPDIVDQNVDPEYEAWIAKRLAELARRLPRELSRGLIHGDIFYDNVLFVGKKLAAIIDLEEATSYYKVFDLGMGIVGSCCGKSTVVLAKARALVDGYQQIRALEGKEKRALQLFIEYAATIVSCWRFWKYHIDTPIAEKADKHRQMRRIAKEIRGIPQARFLDAVCA